MFEVVRTMRISDPKYGTFGMGCGTATTAWFISTKGACDYVRLAF